MIILYRTMQSGFQNIWLFIALSLLHGVSNVLSKGTLNIRIKIWTFIIKCYNRTCCGPRLEVKSLDSPRIRRFNADLEIQNILFEYTTNLVPRLLPSHAPKLRKDPGWGWSRDTPESGVFSISVLKTLREEWQGNYCRCCQM